MTSVPEKYHVKKYHGDDILEWNNFVTSSNQPFFTFKREFIEYHSDRFDDYSLMVFYENVLCALVPANIKGQIVHSHQGLSFGGFITCPGCGLFQLMQMISAVNDFLRKKSILSLSCKPAPIPYFEQIDDVSVISLSINIPLIKFSLCF